MKVSDSKFAQARSSSLGLRCNFNPKQATRLGKSMPSPLSHNSLGRATACLGEFPCTPWLFSINSHAWLKRKIVQQSKTIEKTHKKKEKRKSGAEALHGAEALQSCDHGSLPSLFLLSVLCFAQ